MSHIFATADAARLPLPDRSVDLVIGSPPYLDARTYGIGAQRGPEEWVAWMLDVSRECLRVSRGAVIWIAAGVTRDRNYWPGVEGLMWEWFQLGGECHQYRPCYWHRVGIPGSGGDQWYRSGVEYAVCLKRPGKLPYADPLANGHPPKWAPGGEMSYRLHDGRRVGRPGSERSKDGTMRKRVYHPPALANPGNLLKIRAGGGSMGHVIAHENEAPYPEGVPEFFIKSHCPKRVCATCGTVVQCHNENTAMSSMQSRIPDIRVSHREEQVLLEGVCQPIHEEASRRLPAVRAADREREGNQREQILLEGVRVPMDGEAQEDDQVSPQDPKGVRPASHAASSEGHEIGIRDGTSGDHGEEHRPAARTGGSCPSQEREEGRQPDREPSIDDQIGSRPAAEAKAAHRVPPMRPHDRSVEICLGCGADLSRPGAIRPGIVLDPFSGSGTTVAVAERLGRHGIGFDLRRSQAELGRRRVERPHAPVTKDRKPTEEPTLF